jgi:hypothetical protein
VPGFEVPDADVDVVVGVAAAADEGWLAAVLTGGIVGATGATGTEDAGAGVYGAKSELDIIGGAEDGSLFVNIGCDGCCVGCA